MKKFWIWGLIIWCGAACLSGAAAQRPLYQQGAFYVKLKQIDAPKTAVAERRVAVSRVPALAAIAETYKFEPVMQCMGVFDREDLNRTFLLEFDAQATEADEVMAHLQALPEVETVERVSACYITGGTMPLTALTQAPAVPKEESGDPLYEAGNAYNWHLDLINAEEAWAMQTASADITVAVVDNAVWGGHPDLQIPSSRQYNMLTSENNSTPPSSVDQDAVCDNLSTCYVYNWSHGTHCAGAVGAVNNNGVGIKSIGGGVSVMGVSCPGTDASGLAVQNGFGGISYAAEHGARVISTSWGSYTIAQTEKAIVQACIDKGIVMVSAAGNDASPAVFYPAALPGVISVAAVNSDKSFPTWGIGGSNYGKWVTIAAPGGYLMSNGNQSSACIFSTTYCKSQSYRMHGYHAADGQYYDGMYGTSMATPVTAGLCGLLLSADPTLNSYQIRELLIAGSQPLAEGQSKYIQDGSGVIDAAASLRLLKDLKPMPRNLTAAPVEGTRELLLSWEAPATDNKQAPVAYKIYIGGVETAQTEVPNYTYTINNGGIYRFGVAAVYADQSTSLRACIDYDAPNLYKVDVSYRPEGCGKVSEGGYYPENSKIELKAEANPGCTFTRWMESGKVLGREPVLEYDVIYPETEIEAVFSGTPTAIEAPHEASLKIYPNPACTLVTVESDADLYSVEFYSLSGKLVLKRDAGTGCARMELNIAPLAGGVYVVKTFGANGIAMGKLTVK